MIITTLNSIKKYNDDIDYRIFNRIQELKNNNFITSHSYEKYKQLYKNLMYNHKVSDETKKLISINTKNRMNDPALIKKVKNCCSKGSKNTKWYYDRITLKLYKQLPNEPDIDLEKFCYGRPPMTTEQKIKISKTQRNQNRKCFHNDKFQLSYWFYLDYFNKFDNNDWQPNKKEFKNNKKFKIIINSLRTELLNENFFDYEKFFFHPSICSKTVKILNPGFFDFLSPLLTNWVNKDNIKDELKSYIKLNKDKIDYFCNKYIK